MSRRIAFGGVFTALCVALIYAAAYLPTGRLGMYALSSLAIAGAVIELGIGYGALVYAASAILVFLFTGSINAFLLFVLFFGSYPLIKFFIEKHRGAMAETLLKLLAANLLLAAGYFIFKNLFGVSPVTLPGMSLWLIIGAVIAAQFGFLLYDYILSRLIVYYMDRIRFIRP